jgi:hypothetical protein
MIKKSNQIRVTNNLKIPYQSCHNKTTLIVIPIRDHIDDLSLLLSKY